LAVLLANLAATGVLIGLIWTVQVVHYPLFSAVGPAAWPTYAAAHARRITILVLPYMLLELGTSLLLLWMHPAALPLPSVWLGVALVAAVWISTVAWQGPLFAKLAARWDPAIHRALVLSNWMRTALWTARGSLALWMLWKVSSSNPLP
jgi:hypothetical protein